jgi:hypothetical protein
MTKLNLINQQFGEWTVLEKISSKNYHTYWKCKCSCGNIKEVNQDGLRDGRSKSCGCKRQEIGNNNKDWTGYGEISGSNWATILNNAKNRNIIVNISIQQAWDLFLKQDRKCALSGVELKFAPTRRTMSTHTTASLDRIDSNKDYTIDNVQWIHKDINFMKKDLEQNEFLDMCKKIVEFKKL